MNHSVIKWSSGAAPVAEAVCRSQPVLETGNERGDVPTSSGTVVYCQSSE